MHSNFGAKYSDLNNVTIVIAKEKVDDMGIKGLYYYFK
jgi:hypothetical protein